jgi:hypothetical protein
LERVKTAGFVVCGSYSCVFELCTTLFRRQSRFWLYRWACQAASVLLALLLLLSAHGRGKVEGGGLAVVGEVGRASDGVQALVEALSHLLDVAVAVAGGSDVHARAIGCLESLLHLAEGEAVVVGRRVASVGHRRDDVVFGADVKSRREILELSGEDIHGASAVCREEEQKGKEEILTRTCCRDVR